MPLMSTCQEPDPRNALNPASRRKALQGVALLAGAAFFGRAIANGAPSGFAASDEDGDDDSGRGRGRGRGGDDDRRDPDEAEILATAQIPLDSLVVRIVGDDAGDFVPGELTVDLGQTVTFINVHSDEHTATGSGFDTGIIPEAGTATVTLQDPGVFAYACQIHPEMTGRILVRDAAGLIPIATPIATPVGAAMVRIANLAYDPAELSVAPGASVAWTNEDAAPHTVTAADGEFDSGIFDPGATFSWTFDRPGTFVYQCLLHPQMRGVVTVA